MTLGLSAYPGCLSGRTTRIPVPLTLLDACLVRAIVLFLAAPLVDISINNPWLLPMGVQPPAVLSQRCSPLLCLWSVAAERCCRAARVPAGIVRVLLEASFGRSAGSRQLYAWLASASKILALEGSRFVVVFPCDYALAADLRVEIDS